MQREKADPNVGELIRLLMFFIMVWIFYSQQFILLLYGEGIYISGENSIYTKLRDFDTLIIDSKVFKYISSLSKLYEWRYLVNIQVISNWNSPEKRAT